jgi:hypothetical protein
MSDEAKGELMAIIGTCPKGSKAYLQRHDGNLPLLRANTSYSSLCSCCFSLVSSTSFCSRSHCSHWLFQKFLYMSHLAQFSFHYTTHFDCLLLATCLAYSSTLKMEAACHYVMSVNFYWTMSCYIPEDSSLQNTSMWCEKKNKL